MLTKRVQSADHCGDGNYCEDLTVLWQDLSDFFSQTQYVMPDGKKMRREVGAVTLFVEDGRLKFVLNDRDNSRSLFRVVRNVEKLLDEVNAAVTAPDEEWRKKTQGKR